MPMRNAPDTGAINESSPTAKADALDFRVQVPGRVAVPVVISHRALFLPKSRAARMLSRAEDRCYFPRMSHESDQPQGLEVRTYFVRERNALVARADFGELFVDYYLHLAQIERRSRPAEDTMMKEALAARAGPRRLWG